MKTCLMAHNRVTVDGHLFLVLNEPALPVKANIKTDISSGFEPYERVNSLINAWYMVFNRYVLPQPAPDVQKL